MRIESAIPSPAAAATGQNVKSAVTGSGGEAFATALKQSLQETNALQLEADSLVAKVAAGDLAATQEAMVALQKASLALDLTVQVRNKIIEAYQELMRTQV